MIYLFICLNITIMYIYLYMYTYIYVYVCILQLNIYIYIYIYICIHGNPIEQSSDVDPMDLHISSLRNAANHPSLKEHGSLGRTPGEAGSG